MTIETRLRKYRLATGLTQVDVAQVLNLDSAASVSRWEKGQRMPSAERLLELSALYHRMVNDLLLPQYLESRKRIIARLQRLNKTTL